MSNGDKEVSKLLAVFAVQAGPRIGEELPVRTPVASIGQGRQNDIVIEDDSVSKTHARLEFEGPYWRLTDLGSTNGTFVEGVRLAPEVPTPIEYGMSVRFGAVRMHFRPVQDADPEAAREAYEPPTPPAPLFTGRARNFRLPLWALVLLLLAVAAAIYLAGSYLGDDPGQTPPAVERRVGVRIEPPPAPQPL